jgi:hypothetical protein
MGVLQEIRKGMRRSVAVRATAIGGILGKVVA